MIEFSDKYRGIHGFERRSGRQTRPQLERCKRLSGFFVPKMSGEIFHHKLFCCWEIDNKTLLKLEEET